MQFRKRRACIYTAIVGGALFGGAAVCRAVDVLWDGPDLGDWTTNSNWFDDSLGEPLRDFAEVAIINNGTTAIVSSNVTGAAGPGGIILGQTAGTSGGVRIQTTGSLSSEPGTFNGQTTTGAVTVGAAGQGFFTIVGGGSLTAASLAVGGQVTTTESTLTLGDASGLTATLTSSGGSQLSRTTRIIGPNVNFTTQGNLSLAAASTLIAQIRHPANHSPLKASGTAAVNGRLQLEFNSVTPALGNSWNLIDATSIAGSFTTVDKSAAPLLGPGQAYQIRTVNGGANGKLLQLFVEQMLTLEVNRTTGAVTVRNKGPAVAAANVPLDGYSVISAHSGLNAAGAWNSLTDQAIAGWQEALSDAASLSEVNPGNSTLLTGGASRSLGSPYRKVYPAFGVDPDDISFEYTAGGEVRTGFVEYTGAKTYNNLLLTVNPTTGKAQLKNDSPFQISIEGYSIFSPSNSLLPANNQWKSLADQSVANWQEASPTTSILSELTTSGALTLGAGATLDLGNLYKVAGGTPDLQMEFLLDGNSIENQGAAVFGPTSFSADFDGDADVDGTDFTQASLGFKARYGVNLTGLNFLEWQRQFGSVSTATAAGQSVPEPTSLGLLILGGAAVLSSRGGHKDKD